MRLVAGVISLALFAPFAHAEDPATPPAPPPTPAPPASPGPSEAARARVPFRVVRVMPETRQALLFDRSRNTHVLAEVGGKLDGYTIEDIDDETVSLRRDNQQIVLAAPPHGAGRSRELSPVRVRSALAAPMSDAAAPPPGAPPAPLDPYGDPAGPAGVAAPSPARLTPPAPADALPPEPGIRVAHAPDASAPLASAPALVPGEGGVRVAVAPDVGPGPDPGSRPSAAPSVAGPTASLASAGAPPVGSGAIRVVSAAPSAALADPSAAPVASPAPGAFAGAPSAAPTDPYSTPPAPSAAPGAPSAAPIASPAPGAVVGIPSAAPAYPYSAPPAPSAAPRAPSAALASPSPAAVTSNRAPAVRAASAPAFGATGPGVPDRPSREITEPVAPPPRGPVAATAPARAPVDPKPAEIREVRATDAARAPDKQTADARAMADILTADHPTRSPRAPAELTAPTHGAEVRPTVAPASGPGDAIAISRGDLDSALADFARLTAGVRGSFSASGVVINSVGDGTIFQRAGLRTGDVVTSVDGIRLRTLDDAANLYARAATARAITAQVVRAGKPVTLHVVIQ